MQPSELRSKNLDVKCLRCGAFNLPDNHICGRCGANLPLVYDEEGKVFSLRQRAMERDRLTYKTSNRVSTVGWVLRAGIILAAFYMAYRILHHPHG